MADLARVKDREGLKARREPYWQRIHTGCYVGFRPSARGGRGTWIARAYDQDLRRYRLKALGSFAELTASDQYTAAKKEAEAFADLVASGGHTREKIETVADACRLLGKENTEAENRFKRHVYSDPIAKVKLAKLRRHHTAEWRKRLEEKPALVSRGKSGEQRTRPRSLSSVNRDQAVLRAALAKVLVPGAPNTEAAWQEPLKAIQNVTGRRDNYLDKKQRRALLASLSADAEAFVQALCALPLRPGAVAQLTVADFDRRSSRLTVNLDKAGKGRTVPLQPDSDAARLLAKHSKSKLPAAPLFTRANGSAWDKETWGAAITEAAANAGLPRSTCAYDIRHSVISDLVNDGTPLMLVAQLSGTSVAMIEKHYAKLDDKRAAQALAGLAL